MPENLPIYPQTPNVDGVSLLPGHGTRYRPFFTPGASGSILTRISIASTDNAARDVQFGIGRALTSQANMGTGNIVDGGGGSDTITRTEGSFVDDGWVVGDRMVVNGATTLANDFTAILTGVSALTLTFATATVSAAEALPSGASLYRVRNLHYLDVAASAGINAGSASVDGLDPDQNPSIDADPFRSLTLASGDVMFAALDAALDSGEIVDIIAMGGDF